MSLHRRLRACPWSTWPEPFGVVPVAHLRSVVDGTGPVTTLLQPGPVIRSDAPLLRAVVRMNDLGVRQLLVVDAETESRLVGILAMSDLVRAHARAAPTGPRPAGLQRPGPLPELVARSLMVPPIEVSGSAKVQDLASQLRDGGAKAFVVREGADEFGVLLPEHLLEFARDEDLEKMLIAADLARPAPTVTEGADVAALVEAMREDGTEATVVVDAQTGSLPGW
ncbi:MAG: CBS domain-containing protein [Proteobacteria bacterium]|nr:CBS domain-containing protein [Pseudomonadota bacterium]